jgi:hypothetical protein
MTLAERFWTVVTYVINVFTLSPLSDYGTHGGVQVPLSVDSVVSLPTHAPAHVAPRPGPIFKPPGRPRSGPGADFVCDYSNMPGWRACSTPEDRTCWLINDKGGIFNISTDYEAVAPRGIQRNYTLVISNGQVNADGLIFPEGKLFNNSYPGPLLQACWGDVMQVTVINKMSYNGTSIHWHGIRQNQTMHMDGVNGVTQCPIAPGDQFTYKFNVTQYGSSWYHSHYSLQYADGAVGPMVRSRCP